MAKFLWSNCNSERYHVAHMASQSSSNLTYQCYFILFFKRMTTVGNNYVFRVKNVQLSCKELILLVHVSLFHNSTYKL